MAIFIDSAKLDEIEQAARLSWISGITTNPLLLTESPDSPQQVLKKGITLIPGLFFYQVTTIDVNSMEEEAYRVRDILGDHLVIKTPPTPSGFELASRIGNEIPCCPTALYSPAQALIAREVGARYIAVYVNRATRLLGDGVKLLRDMVTVLENSSTEVLAASIKTQDEASAALLAGAHHLTLPLDVLVKLGSHEFSDAAVRQFQDKGTGLIDI